MIKLYGVAGSRAGRCLWMLEELGVEYENIPTDFGTGCKTPEYLEINPNGHIPALDDDGLVLFESLAINLHLARKYDAGLWPKNPDDQSRANQWSVWAMTEIEPPLMQILMNRAFLPEAKRDATRADTGEKALGKVLRVLERALGDQDYLLANQFSVADLNVHGVLYWGRSMGGVDFSATPAVDTWLTRCAERPALVRVLGTDG